MTPASSFQGDEGIYFLQEFLSAGLLVELVKAISGEGLLAHERTPNQVKNEGQYYTAISMNCSDLPSIVNSRTMRNQLRRPALNPCQQPDLKADQNNAGRREIVKPSYLIVVVASALMLSACSTMQPPRYAISVDNITQLKNFKGARVAVISLTQSANFAANCRLFGPIEPADGLTVPQFVSKAMNDEFKMADLYSTEGVKLTGDITEIGFSSAFAEGLTSGHWDIGIRLESSNGEELSVNNKHTFRSGFDAITACNATADALSPAVQDLLLSVINHPDFPKLLK